MGLITLTNHEPPIPALPVVQKPLSSELQDLNTVDFLDLRVGTFGKTVAGDLDFLPLVVGGVGDLAFLDLEVGAVGLLLLLLLANPGMVDTKPELACWVTAG